MDDNENCAAGQDFKPTPYPAAALKNIRSRYVKNMGQRSVEYFNEVAECVTAWFFENFEGAPDNAPSDHTVSTRETIGDLMAWEFPAREVEINGKTFDLTDVLVEVALLKINNMGCGEFCVPVFGRHNPASVQYDPRSADGYGD
jgi:hypothetical protein